MKKELQLTVLFLLLFVAAFSQNVPLGMKYQAVARNLSGNVIANQVIALKINLITNGKTSSIYYSEVHTVTTNQLGLFSLAIGEGKVEKGAFANVPWSTDEIWMQVSIKDKSSSLFTTISNSKLLAVPYAFHAMTASELVTKGVKQSNTSGTNIMMAQAPNSSGNVSGSNASNGNSWNVGGNLGTTPPHHFLGTADNVLFIIKTNNIERLKIAADGNVDIKRSLSIGADLNVDSSVNLNRTTGSTLNNGPFTVGTTLRRSPTSLLGTLTVDADQATVLGGTLSVDKATQLNSTLTVSGITNLNNNLNVNRASPTLLTGTLQVDLQTNLNDSLRVNNMKSTTLTGILTGQQDVTFNQHLLLDNATLNADTLNATSTPPVTGPNGALIVMGGEWINKNLVVRGDASFGGNTSFSGPVRVTDGTESLNPQTGALTVGGGAGINKNFNVGGAVKLDSSLNVVGSSTIGGALSVTKATTLSSTLSANGQVTITTDLPGEENNFDSYPLRVQGSNQGIAIKIKGDNEATKNYVSFFDGNGNLRGRIEGNTLTEMTESYEFASNVAILTTAVAVETSEMVIGIAEGVQAGLKTVAATLSTTGCVGLGACVTLPIPSLIVEAASNTVLKVANIAVYVANVAVSAAELGAYIQHKTSTFGIAYESGSADYAEWLLKENPSETFKAGDIVAIRNGRITKNTDGASQLLVISFKPIVLGNMPKEGTEKDYEKVAFLGQVPVYVWGSVEKGDYILSDGLSDGFGIAVNPAKMKLDQYKKIVGVAWTSAAGKGVNVVNLAIGLNRNDMADVLVSQQAEIAELKAQGQQTANILAKLVPGFKEAAGIKDAPVVSTTTAVATAANQLQSGMVVPEPSNIIYNGITEDQLDESMAMAEKVFLATGAKFEDHPFWKRMKSEPGYKASIKNTLKEKMQFSYHTHDNTNKKLHKHK